MFPNTFRQKLITNIDSRYYQKKGWKACLVCADTFRAGAYDQLKQVTGEPGCQMFVFFWGGESPHRYPKLTQSCPGLPDFLGT
jgi:hypothetical protein